MTRTYNPNETTSARADFPSQKKHKSHMISAPIKVNSCYTAVCMSHNHN